MRPTSPASGGLLLADAVDEFADAVDAVRDEIVTRLARTDAPFSGASAGELAGRVGEVDLDVPLGDPARVLAELRAVYLDDAVWFHHPRYLAHLNCPVAVPAVAADLLASAVNSSLDTWDQSAGATHIERRLLAWTARRLGLGAWADGAFTSGGTASNLHALLLARESTGVTDLRRLRVLAGADAHFSVQRAARVLGLGEDAVVPVGLDARHRMRPDELARRLADLPSYGLAPMAVVATAGTTDFGAVDPLADIAEVAHRHGVWLHVDAAYGGGLITSAAHRRLLDGVERADSVTVDYHKTFFQPVAASVVLVRDAAELRRLTHHADYLNPADADPEQRPNQVDTSMQTTRRFDALKLWWTLRELGADAIGAHLDRVIALASTIHDRIAADPDFEIEVRPQLSTVVFRYAPDGVPDATLDAVNAAARERLFASGAAAVAATRVRGRTWLKFTLLNPTTTIEDVQAVLEALRGHAAETLRGAGMVSAR